MRNISVSLAALALVLSGSLATVASAENLERQNREEKSDLASAQTISTQAFAQTSASQLVADDNSNAKADRG